MVAILREGRYLAWKVCKNGDACWRPGQLQQAAAFPKVRGGGTADVCSECKRRAVSESMKRKHAEEKEAFVRKQREHFDRVAAKGRTRDTNYEP